MYKEKQGKGAHSWTICYKTAKLKEPGDFKVEAGEDVVRCHQIESLVMRRVIRVNARGKDQMAKAVRE